MSILMNHRDYVADETGSVTSVSGENALLNEVLFRLSARRGSFPLMPEFGSRLYLLRHEKPSDQTALARQYAAEALEEMVDVVVTDAAVSCSGDGLNIHVELSWQGEPLSVELEG